MAFFHDWFTVKRFTALSAILTPLAAVIGLFSLGIGLYQGLITSPLDYQQGDAVRIMYVHVPSAWLALAIYCFVALASISGFVWKNPLSFIMATSAAPIGACFALICLITGAIWGKPMWGTWWVWDARLTSMLILFFFYLGYILLHHSFDDATQGEKAAGILSIIGLINIPIIKFSVDWWQTLHQPASILRKGGIAIDPSMLSPLLWMFAGCTCYAIVFTLLRSKTKLLKRKIARQLQSGH